MSRPTRCSECGCFGHHLPRCPEDERTWELAQMRAEEEAEAERAEIEEPFDAVAEIMAHFISIYGRHGKT